MTSLHREQFLIDIIIGPRQVGKTTAAMDISSRWNGEVHYASADLAMGSGPEWIVFHWDRLRLKKAESNSCKLLILDEIQKIKNWSEAVKGQWDQDRMEGNPIKVLLLGSSSLLLTRGMTESLAGRFFLHRFTHWSFPECAAAFGWDLDRWLYFGGYPGAAPLVDDQPSWKRYITDSLIETVIARDVLALQTVHKPALLRNLFTLAAAYPAQVLSYNKMLGQMHDAGNTTTLAHYLKLMETAFLITGLENFSGSGVRKKSSSPKLVLWNNALITALDTRDPETARADDRWWGRLMENAVGAHLLNNLRSMNYHVMYWRRNNREVDYIVLSGRNIWAIEVKSGETGRHGGLTGFCKKHREAVPLIVGPGGMTLSDFFSTPPEELLA